MKTFVQSSAPVISIVLLGGVLVLTGCRVSLDRTLETVPKPGLVGNPTYEFAHDSASEELLEFESRASEAEIRSAFESYCRKRGLHRSTDDDPVHRERDWFESDKGGFGIYVSASERNPSLLSVTIFRRS